MASITSSGLASGINTDELISKLMDIEKKPITNLQNKKTTYQNKIAAVLQIKTSLGTFKSALDSLNSADNFNTRTASVTKTPNGDSLLTATPQANAAEGSYEIEIMQLAKANKKASHGWIDYNLTPIASQGGQFKFKVGSSGAVTTINVSSAMTMANLRDAINSSGANVTASIINDGTGTNPYRLALTSKATGSANAISIIQNDTMLDFQNKKVEAAYAYTSNTYSGLVESNEGNNYLGAENKTYLIQMVAGGQPESGSARYKYSTDGGITWYGSGGALYDGSNGVAVNADGVLQNIDGSTDASTTTEGVKIRFTGGVLAVDDKFSIDVFNPEMQSAKDAVIKVDNHLLVKDSNTITDAIEGVTLNLLKADANPATLTVSRDTSSAKQGIKGFVDAYNSLMAFFNTQLSYDPETGEKQPLLGDATILEIRRKIADTVTGRIPGLSTTGYTNLSQIGIKSDLKTGILSMDEAKLDAALNQNPDAVARLFIGAATASNSTVSYMGKQSATQPGKYSIYVSRPPEKAVIAGDDRIDLSTNGLTEQETLTFMYSKNKQDAIPAYNTFSVTLDAGSTINTIVNTLNSAFATNNVGLTAMNDNGKLKLTSTDYGANTWFQVTTNKAGDGINSFQVWNSITTRSDEGVDIAGTINGHTAMGSGNKLVSNSGFAETGLSITVDATSPGGYGTIQISSGIADKLPSILSTYLDDTTGILDLKEQSIQSTINSIDDRVQQMNDRISRMEDRLRAQFTRLETLISQYNATSQYLTTQLANLPKISEK